MYSRISSAQEERKRCVLQSKQTNKNKQTHRHTHTQGINQKVVIFIRRRSGTGVEGVDTGGCILFIWKIKLKEKQTLNWNTILKTNESSCISY